MSMKTTAAQRKETSVTGDTIWKNTIKNELKQTKQWEQNFDFLIPEEKKIDVEPLVKEDEERLNKAAREMNDPQSRKKLASKTGHKGLPQGEEYRKFDQRLPQQKFSGPQTESQELGWDPRSLEIFGVANYGLKRTDIKY